MTAQCTCKPSSPAVMCPIEEHRTRAEVEGLRAVGARSGFFGMTIEEFENGARETGRLLPVAAAVEMDVDGSAPDHVIGRTSGVDMGKPEDGCE